MLDCTVIVVVIVAVVIVIVVECGIPSGMVNVLTLHLKLGG